MDRELHQDTFAPIRAVARRLALDVLARLDGASGRGPEALARHRVHFIYMHALEAQEEVPFRALLSELSKKHRFISHSEAAGRVLEGRIDAPYVSFSFDDGLKSCLRAARILDEFSAPACFYVCPPAIGETDRGAIEKYCTRNLRISPAEFMNWQEIDQLLRRGHEVGAHTMSHPVLSQLSNDRIAEEVGGAREALRRKVGEAGVRHFAWPFGHFGHFSAAAARIVFDLGFHSCASAQRGCHVVAPESDPRSLCLRRDLVMGGWPIAHCLYFLSKSSRLASGETNGWPAGWGAV